MNGGDLVLTLFGVALIGFALGGAAVRYVAAQQMKAYKAMLRGLERELYAAQKSKAVIQ